MSIESLNSGVESRPENDPEMEALIGRMKQIIEGGAGKTSQERLLVHTNKSIDKHFSDNKEVFTDYIAWLEGVKDMSDEELAREAAQRWYKAAVGGFGEREVELRERAYMGDGAVRIKENNPFLYNLKGDELELHVQSARTLSTIEKVREIKSALRELAIQLRRQEELSNVKEITVTSWIVREKPRLMERLGFTIDGLVSEEDVDQEDIEGRGKDAWRAHVSVEDFLEKYTDKPAKQ